MTTVFWIVSVLTMGGACLCAAQSSCYREQGDSEHAKQTSVSAVALFLIAVISAVTAWGMQ